MIALYIAMDSFGTACNVTGDGAIALVVDKIYKWRATSYKCTSSFAMGGYKQLVARSL